MTDAIVYAVASGKGGVGKTTTAVNLGAGFAKAGHSVVVVDLDLGMANLGDFLEATPAGPTLHDVLAGEATLDDALSHAEPGLDVILGSEDLSDFGKADPTGFRKTLVALRDRYDVVLLDSGGGLSHDTALPIGLADSVILVSTVEEPAVQNTAKTLELAEWIDGTVAGLILTRSGGGKEADPTSIANRLDLRLIGTVPEDSTVAESARAGETLLGYDADSPAAQAYLEIVYDLLDEPLPMNLGKGAAGTSIPEEVEREGDAEAEAGGAVEDVGAALDETGENDESAVDEPDEVDDAASGEAEDGTIDESDETTEEGDDETTVERDDVTTSADDVTAGEDDVTTEDDGEVTIGETGEGVESAVQDTDEDGSADQDRDAASDEVEVDGEAEDDGEAGSDDEKGDTEDRATGTDDGQQRHSRSLLSRLTGGLFG